MASPYRTTTGEGLLAGLASAIPSAIQGYRDTKAQDLKQKEIEARISAQEDNQKWKKVAQKMEAESAGYDLTKDSLGDYDLQRQQGYIDPATMQRAGLLSKGVEYDPETGDIRTADWKMQDQQLKGLLAQSKLTGQRFKEDPYINKQRQELGKAGSEWLTKDRGTFVSNLKGVDKALDILSSGKDVTGGYKGLVPEGMLRDTLTPDTATAQQAMQKAIQDTLRPTLGAQFTEKEGERIMNLSFNPRLGEKENARRAQELKDLIQKKIKTNDALHDFLRKGGDVSQFPFEDYGMVSNMSGNAFGSEASDGQMSVSADEMSEAEKWARDNPNDPRSAEIMKRLGR